jgi:hypothetical protein
MPRAAQVDLCRPTSHLPRMLAVGHVALTPMPSFVPARCTALNLSIISWTWAGGDHLGPISAISARRSSGVSGSFGFMALGAVGIAHD